MTTITKKEAIERAFCGKATLTLKFDRRKKSVKEVLSVFSEEELDEIEGKRITRKWGKFRQLTEPKPNLVEELNSLKHFAASSGRYSKILIEGRSNIYLASPIYQHQDYNKSIFRPNTEQNRKIAEVINRWLLRH